MKKHQAFYEHLVAPMEGRMLRSIWRIVGNGEDARDALQEALTIIWKRQEIIKSHPNSQALILKICLDCAYDVLRKNRRFLRFTEPGFPIPRDEYPQPPGRPASDSGSCIDENVPLEQEILTAVSRLSRKQALAVLLRIIQEEPYAVIAQVLGCGEVTARIHVLRARAKLRRELAHLSGGTAQKGKDHEEKISEQ